MIVRRFRRSNTTGLGHGVVKLLSNPTLATEQLHRYSRVHTYAPVRLFTESWPPKLESAN
jgi:hypothetical protein